MKTQFKIVSSSGATIGLVSGWFAAARFAIRCARIGRTVTLCGYNYTRVINGCNHSHIAGSFRVN